MGAREAAVCKQSKGVEKAATAPKLRIGCLSGAGMREMCRLRVLCNIYLCFRGVFQSMGALERVGWL